MNEIEILEKQKTKDSRGTVQLPANFICVGEVSVDDIKIYINQDVYKIIEKFSREDTTCERGGILLGDFIENSDKKNIIICAFIEAKYTDASASTLTFTHETWDYIYKEQERLYPDMKIVGWQHTHPSYGIFLSNYDIFIQENFFNLPWQIAYVVDPIADTRGFFQWRKDKVEKTGGFYIFDEVGRKINIKKHKTKEPEKKKISKITLIIMSLIILILAGSTAVLYMQRNNIEKKFLELIKINSEVLEEKQKLEEEHENEKSTVPVDNSSEKQKELKKESENESDVVEFRVYTIKEGDTLQKVCNENNLDYTSRKSEILKLNSIKDENKIYIGETMYLPIK